MNNIKFIVFGVLFFLILLFFKPVFLENKLPIPSDTLVGLYHPFRDLYNKEYPRGIPFKNFLITDPVRQQYPWRYLSLELEKKLELPLWNPYNFSGSPLLANFQSAAFYPLNSFFLFLPFETAWTLLVILQPLLGGIFMFLYLRHMKLGDISSFLGAFVFSFSGFSIAWMQWNTVFHVMLWLPLILLAKEILLKRFSFGWIAVFILAEACAIFAGHLQTLFYTFLVSNTYLVARIIQIYYQKKTSGNFLPFFFNKYKVFLLAGVFVAAITAIQWYPTVEFISYSAREIDQVNWQSQEGWFIPFQHLIQFVAPDFFGNPATLNYWGIWNYAEFIGYISIFPLIMALVALLYRRDKKTYFFGGFLAVSLLFALPTPLAKIPFWLDFPFLSTTQPTRLLSVITFCLSVLSALGLDYYLKHKHVRLPLMIVGVTFVLLWGFILKGYGQFSSVTPENIMIAKRNLILPTGIFVVSSLLILLNERIKNIRYTGILLGALVILVIFDLFRLGEKFLPFTSRVYLFPSTKTIEFLQKNTGNYRIMAIDDRILPPNFSIMYKLQTVSGYDPLYLLRYGELIAASERGKPDISPPFGFNRIITPKNYDSKTIDLLGVKYVLSLTDINSSKLKKVFQEGETRVYENQDVFPRAFMVAVSIPINNKQAIIEALFDAEYFDLNNAALIEERSGADNHKQTKYKPTAQNFFGEAIIESYAENKVLLRTESNADSLLVLTDTYYPVWKVKVDGEIKEIKLTNFNLRGVFVPKGEHTVLFYNSLL